VADTDPTLRQCTRDGCTMTLRPPWKRPPGTRHDYHADKCRPPWLRGDDHAHGYTAPRPYDTWVRSGARVADPTVPVGPPLPSTLPADHLVCTDCGTAVHTSTAVRGLCGYCVITAVFAITKAADEADTIALLAASELPGFRR
jgi:hypothetical protein